MIAEINKEEVVVAWLKNHGYYRVENSIDKSISNTQRIIEADGKMRRMVVGVSQNQSNNSTLKSTIIKLANAKRREAWIAVVKSSDNEIYWSCLE